MCIFLLSVFLRCLVVLRRIVVIKYGRKLRINFIVMYIKIRVICFVCLCNVFLWWIFIVMFLFVGNVWWRLVWLFMLDCFRVVDVVLDIVFLFLFLIFVLVVVDKLKILILDLVIVEEDCLFWILYLMVFICFGFKDVCVLLRVVWEVMILDFICE